MNKPVRKREVKSAAQKWEELINELQDIASGAESDEYRIAKCIAKAGALSLIQPFDWMKWEEPLPEPAQCKLMDLETAVKHITRLCRAERFYENSFKWHVKSGLLLGLCLVVRGHTRGESAPRVMKKAS